MAHRAGEERNVLLGSLWEVGARAPQSSCRHLFSPFWNCKSPSAPRGRLQGWGGAAVKRAWHAMYSNYLLGKVLWLQSFLWTTMIKELHFLFPCLISSFLFSFSFFLPCVCGIWSILAYVTHILINLPKLVHMKARGQCQAYSLSCSSLCFWESLSLRQELKFLLCWLTKLPMEPIYLSPTLGTAGVCWHIQLLRAWWFQICVPMHIQKAL